MTQSNYEERVSQEAIKSAEEGKAILEAAITLLKLTPEFRGIVIRRFCQSCYSADDCCRCGDDE